MKKLIAILMVLSLVGVMVAGCAPKTDTGTSTDTTKTPASSTTGE